MSVSSGFIKRPIGTTLLALALLLVGVAVFPLPFLVWWEYARAPLNVRPTVLLCAWAATLWLAGSLVWFGSEEGALYVTKSPRRGSSG